MAKDAKGHGSEKRGINRDDLSWMDDHPGGAKIRARMEMAARIRAGDRSWMNDLRGGAEVRARMEMQDHAAANALADGNPKAGVPPVHPAHAGMSALVNTVKKAFGRK